MAVITISRELGSLGDEIAKAVAESLHYQCADKELIWKLMRGYGLQLTDLQGLDEKMPSHWDFLSMQRRIFLNFIEKAIYDLAGKGRVVIVGRGGQLVLKELPGALHVRIFAPRNVRIRRLMERAGFSENQANQIILQNDHDSSGYIRSFFNADWSDPRLYHLLVNTGAVAAETAAELIIKAVHSPTIQSGTERAPEKIANLVLVQESGAKLMEVLGSEVRNIKVTAEKGVLFLSGTVTSKFQKENSERAVIGLEGVKRVDNQISVLQYSHLLH
jgi:cytidylate kinase